MTAGPPVVTPGGYLPANPGSQPLLRKAMTCNRPFTQPSQLDFRDRLLKAPATTRSYDLSEARVKKLIGTPWDSFRLFSLSDQPVKDQPRRDLSE
jgi:hypothetical protein